MKARAILPWLLAAMSAILLDLPFPIAGPMPDWRMIFAWFAFVPLLVALVGGDRENPVSLRQGALLGYLCGTMWYAGNCSWVYYTVHLYGNLPSLVAALVVLVCALILGGYFALFGFLVVLLRQRLGRGVALLAASFLWVAIDLLAYHLTSVPWDQLGYSQIDNPALTWLAPWAGVYGITFALMVSNSCFSLFFLPEYKWRERTTFKLGLLFAAIAFLMSTMVLVRSYASPRTARAPVTATLIQPSLDVGERASNAGVVQQNNITAINNEGRLTCQPYLAGVPEQGLTPQLRPGCEQGKTTLIAWPEAPSPLYDIDSRFRQTVSKLSADTHATAVIGLMGVDVGPADSSGRSSYQIYNSATVTAPDGTFVGRYDKIHLVPYGEYVPYRDMFPFIRQLTQDIGDLSRGTTRKVFNTDGHRYGVFICYESVFADEVRQFPLLGAEVLVNLSDDGWYGDTAAPWQHLNMARMRAIENHRWLLRDTNDGVTAIIDPYGRITASIARHRPGVLTAPFGFERDITFYTRHGDIFADLCAILSLLLLLRAQPFRLGARVRLHQKSGQP